MMELILLQQADVDIQAAFDRHEHYQEGRGEVFMRHLDAAFTLLRRNPEMAPPYAGPYRRMLVRDFPYGIFYSVQPSRLIVVAVMDPRRDPETIRRKVLRQGR